MTDARQVDGLKANIEYWFNLDEESFSNYLLHENSVLSAESTSESVSFDLFRENLEKAKIACRKLLYAFDTNVALIPNIEKFIRTVNIHTSNLRKYLTNESYIVSSTFEVFIGGFQKLLNDCLNSLIKLRDFAYSLQQETDVLIDYARIGVLISSDPDYKGSSICKLEKIVLAQIKSRDASKRALRGEPSLIERVVDEDGEPTHISDLVKHYLGPTSILRDDDLFERMFHAIVAPSMEGKTQSTFVFRKIRPLYFLLTVEPLKGSAVQPIYKSFTDLSDEFREMAIEDYSCINALTGRDNNSIDYDYVSAHSLFEVHGDFQFLTLGFLVALIEHANANFDPNIMNWMKFFATSARNFTFRAMTIKQVRARNLVGNYALFFDEFEAAGWTVMVRNLARAAWIPLFVANTNTNAANLVGKKQSRLSRTVSDFSWSLVSVSLNSINMIIFSGIDDQVLSKVDLIIGAAGNEQGLVRAFFDDFENNQLPHLRPGFVKLIIENIDKIYVASSLTFNDILTKIVNSIALQLTEKKPRMLSNLKAVLGTLALFMDNAYLSNDQAELAQIFHRKIYLQDHFYYLVNPVDNTKWAFLTYPPSSDSSTTRRNSENRPLRVATITFGNIGACLDWKKERTYFKSEEIIPMFAFLAVFNDESIEACLREGLEDHNSNPEGTGDTRNMAQNVPLNGNELEVLSAVCVIDASHQQVGNPNSTFCGQDGKSFLTNLVENLIKAEGFRRKNKVFIDFPEIDTILNHMHVPYLFPSGMKLPKFFKDHLADAAGFNNRSVHFGEYRRTPDKNEIDSIFKYFIKNGENIPTVASCVVECKNWEKDLYVSHLKLILEKAVKNSAILSLTICNSIGGATKATIDSLKNECTVERWNIMKLDIDSATGTVTKRFKLVPYFPELPLVADPQLTCIVLELATINF